MKTRFLFLSLLYLITFNADALDFKEIRKAVFNFLIKNEECDDRRKIEDIKVI
jgi:hypothetical protein